MKLDKDEVRSHYDQERFFEQQKYNSGLSALEIFIAVLAAIVVAWFLKEAYDRYQAKQALIHFNYQLQMLDAQMKRDAQRFERDTERSIERMRQGMLDRNSSNNYPTLGDNPYSNTHNNSKLQRPHKAQIQYKEKTCEVLSNGDFVCNKN